MSRLQVVWVNPTPARTGKRAKLWETRASNSRGPTPQGGFQWPVYPNPITTRTMHAYEEWGRTRQRA